MDDKTREFLVASRPAWITAALASATTMMLMPAETHTALGYAWEPPYHPPPQHGSVAGYTAFRFLRKRDI
jgi:hypothetical protein